MAGRPATFMDKTLKLPEEAAARSFRLAGAARHKELAASKETERRSIVGYECKHVSKWIRAEQTPVESAVLVNGDGLLL
ncbi:hypothetical protein RHS01_05444 [Rhizoctonia solani]|uniref:Uncharacterized protein n=1 Tax=Rhizoctonia solani TaxID=456999 RepID=A0A8H7M4J8_9AGAM|nr:hypothetical protein RHS01_05444 [Rhizoctonia solani]